MSLLSSPTPTTQAEDVYQDLKTRLMIGAFHPGQKLSIRKLSEAMGAGQASVREALKRLASERVLHSLAKRSYVVPSLDRHRAAGLFELRALLECEAGALSAGRFPVRTLEALNAAIARMERALTERHHDRYMIANHRFHFLIYNRCGNPDMIAMIEQLWMQTGPSLRQGLDTAAPDSSWSDLHHALVPALAARNADAVRSHLREDVRWNWEDSVG